jgi:hypothetical protein
MLPIPLNLAVEDSVSEALAQAILAQSKKPFFVKTRYNRGGFGYIRKHIGSFNKAAAVGNPYFVLTDLDRAACPSKLIDSWLGCPQNGNLLFRIAVEEAESWILADRDAFAALLGIARDRIPVNADTIRDPKEFLVRLAKSARHAQVKDAIVPRTAATASVGPGYNSTLTQFIQNRWNAKRAAAHSMSLKRAILAIKKFRPSYPGA